MTRRRIDNPGDEAFLLHEAMPGDLLADFSDAIVDAASNADLEDWIVKNLVRFPNRMRAEKISDFIEDHFGSGLQWRSRATMCISVTVDSGKRFASAYELIGFLHEFQRKFESGDD